MADDYEYQRFDLPPYGSDIQDLLQPLGDEAWEITYIGRYRGEEGRYVRWVDARRLHYGIPGPSSWEYKGFNTDAMPSPNWDEHIASRGWQKIGEWYRYITSAVYAYKRTDAWRGTDDGGIAELLSGHGYRLWPNSPETVCRIIMEILDIKWQLSVETGYDVGTQRAVESWLSSH